MRALILAAGIGQRLSALGETRGPKSLLRFDGASLLERHIRLLNRLGILEISIVVGFEHGKIEAAIASMALPRRPSLIFNPHFSEGSALSLHYLNAALRRGGPTILMDADVLYDPHILAWLVDSPHENCFLLDRDFVPGDEPVKLCVRNGRLIEFRKQLAANLRYDYSGESVGFFKLSGTMSRRLASRLDYYLGRGKRQAPYEDVLRDLLLARPQDFSFEDITGLAWIEIDFPEDVNRAEREILPNIGGLI